MTAVMWAGILAIGVTVLLVLHFFPPGQYPIYPVCPLRQSTGLDCPGCGGLRAMHQLTNGNLAAAWQLNPFVFVLLPLAVYEVVIRRAWKKELPNVLGNSRVLITLGLLLLAFTVVRNLPKLAQWFS
ncbi:MAG: hypothetical protein K0Q55_3594 [Verrucomicrobia bacterium]|nr:hypothetical protein [Verrucomicrobiota bacterium]